MAVTFRGSRVLFLQSAPGDGPKPPELPPCEYCGKSRHPFAPTWGSHLGNSMWLSDAILEDGEPEAHDWYTGKRTIAAHHLICSEALEDDDDWAEYCPRFGYDINCRANGVMLPSVMNVACELHVAVHRGNHAGGWAYDVNMAYPKAVMALLRKVKAKLVGGAFCEAPEDLSRMLDKISAQILQKLERFEWTLSTDGLDYQEGGNGCGGGLHIPEKAAGACPRARRHGAKHAVTGKPLVKRALQVGR
jgi:hypothetical protein